MSIGSVRVLGPVDAVGLDGAAIDLKGPRHRTVLARLVAAGGRTVPLQTLIDDLWEDGGLPAGPAGAVRTFVAALRVALEPDRPPRTPPRLIVTRGPGYALEAAPDVVDAWRFEAVLRHVPAGPDEAVAALGDALALWRGPAYADLADARWAAGERARLTGLRLDAVERLARARLDAGHPGDAVPDLDAHTLEHPWREEGWRLLALALYRSRREGDALAVLRRARARLADELGADPGPGLARLETDVLRRAPHLDDRSPELWSVVTGLGARATLEATTPLLRTLAVHGGGPATALARHAAAVRAAEDLDDPELTARLLGAYDVPSVWSRSDDPAASALLADAAGRCLHRLPGAQATVRARLLATVAIETRGLPSPHGPEAARQAETLAREAGDPAVLLHALAARTVQSFHRLGAAAERAALGREIVALASAHDRPTSVVLGHLVLLQAHGALGDLGAAADHARRASALAETHEVPGVGVLVGWFEAMRAASWGDPDAEQRYRAADRALTGTGMPGVQDGLLALAVAGLRVWRGLPVGPDGVGDPGPYAPWIRPHLLLADGRRAEAAAALARVPDPAPGHVAEALWVLAGRAAMALDDASVLARAVAALGPAVDEVAGAGSGMLTVGPVRDHLAAFTS